MAAVDDQQGALFDDESPKVHPAPFLADAGTPSALVSVSISLAIIERLSEGLYSSPNKTFEELVSNSYDAGAERVWIYMPADLSQPEASILVVDDGQSMDIEGLKDLWRIGESRKRESNARRTVRQPIGKFGIGKLATYVLAEELTYIVFKDGKYRAVTMDYEKVQGGEMAKPKDLSLVVVDLSLEEAKEALLVNLKDYGYRLKPVFDALFPSVGDGPEHWTAAIMTRLKKVAKGIQQGRLKWVLSTAIPLNPSFGLIYNGDEIEASKAQGGEVWNYTIGESEGELQPDKQIGSRAKVKIGETEVSAYALPLAGTIWGEAQLFADSLQKGNSERLGRSHGYFVRVRNRLINLDDPSFNVGPEHHHGTFTRFRMVINADDLDDLVASPRESLQDSPQLRELKSYMLAVFNRARTIIKTQDESDAMPLLTKQGRISNPPKGLTQGPLRRMLRRASQGDPTVRATLGIKLELGEQSTLVEENTPVLEQVLIEPLGDDMRLIQYDPQRKAAVLNQSHPFIANYIDEKGAQEALKLLGLTELLTQAYMLDENIDAETVNRVMMRRDAFLRDLVKRHPRSAPVIATHLREASNDENALEDAVADALRVMGYSVQSIGGKGTPDGIATVRLGMRTGQQSESYALTYDAKSTGKAARDSLNPPTQGARTAKPDRIQAGTARTSILRVHRERAATQFNLAIAPKYTLLVAPGFQGDGDDAALIGAICENDGITPITIDDLARLVELFPLRRLSPLRLRELFASHSPEASRNFVNMVEAQSAPDAPPVTEVIELLVQYSERKTPVTIHTIMTGIFERRQLDLDYDEVAAIVSGLAALAPENVYFDGQLVALNTTPLGLVGELSKTLGEYPVRLAEAYKAAIPTQRRP